MRPQVATPAEATLSHGGDLLATRTACLPYIFC
jgi:hypothetical protein